MHGQVANSCDIRPLNANAVAVLVHLEQDCLASEHEQIGVLGDDAVDVALLLEEAQLRVGLVRSNDVVDVLDLERLTRQLYPSPIRKALTLIN